MNFSDPGGWPDADALRSARLRIDGRIVRTPVLTSRTLDEKCGCRLFFKAENLQRVGAFKARGAANAVLSLPDSDAEAGVVTHSSGNHGAALAWAAASRGVPATIVMPETASRAKVENVRRYGGTIAFCRPTLEDREAVAARILTEAGGVLVHPFDDWRVIEGQATAAMEMLDEIPDLDAIVVPIGGGGLISGTCLAVGHAAPGVRVYGVEPENAAEAAAFINAGQRIEGYRIGPGIADGLMATLSPRTFAVIRERVEGIVTVSDAETIAAMRLVWMVLKSLVEPSAAVVVAALLEGRIPLQGQRVGVILSGGNVDLDRLPWPTQERVS
ncbi:MAG: threonine/serine dehydratase [Opitutaceae bacterium]